MGVKNDFFGLLAPVLVSVHAWQAIFGQDVFVDLSSGCVIPLQDPMKVTMVMLPDLYAGCLWGVIFDLFCGVTEHTTAQTDPQPHTYTHNTI
jgi:hypothetical protein